MPDDPDLTAEIVLHLTSALLIYRDEWSWAEDFSTENHQAACEFVNGLRRKVGLAPSVELPESG